MPWWIFGALGGVATIWLGNQFLTSELGSLGLLPAGIDETDLPAGFSYAIKTAYFVPGLVVGCVLGWFVIRPVNAVLGWLFRAFHQLFDLVTGMYGWTVGVQRQPTAATVPEPSPAETPRAPARETPFRCG